MKNVEELDLYKEYKFAYDKAHELEFFDKVQEALYYYEYAQQLKKQTIIYGNLDNKLKPITKNFKNIKIPFTNFSKTKHRPYWNGLLQIYMFPNFS